MTVDCFFSSSCQYLKKNVGCRMVIFLFLIFNIFLARRYEVGSRGYNFGLCVNLIIYNHYSKFLMSIKNSLKAKSEKYNFKMCLLFTLFYLYFLLNSVVHQPIEKKKVVTFSARHCISDWNCQLVDKTFELWASKLSTKGSWI